MKFERNITLLLLGGFLLALLYYLGRAIFPVIISFILSYLLLPICDNLEKKLGFPRAIASLVSAVLVYLTIFIFFYSIPIFLLKMKGILPGFLPHNLENHNKNLDYLLDFWHHHQLDWQNLISDNMGSLWSLLLITSKYIFSSGANLINFGAILFISPIISYYILNNWRNITSQFEEILPVSYREDYRNLALQISSQMRNYLKTQLFTCIILSLIYGTFLFIMRLNFGFYIGLIVGIFSFVPFIPQITGLFLSMIVAYSQYNDFHYILRLAILYLIIYIFESNFLVPKLMSKNINLHPAWIIISCIICGNLYGFFGILFALPISVMINILVKFFVGKYKASNLYEQ